MTNEEVITVPQVKVLVEHFESTVKTLSEGVNARFDKLDGRMDKMDGRMDKMDGRMDKMDGRLDKMDGRLDKMDGRLDKQEDNMTSIKEMVALLLEGQTEIKAELRHKIPFDDFEKLEKRVTRLETKVA